MRDRDRYLKQRGRHYHYVRRVPARISHLDTRGTIEESLGTDSLDVARRIRDAVCEADEAYWRSLAEGVSDDAVTARWEAARARAKAMGISFRRIDDLVENAPLSELVERVRSVEGKTPADRRRTADAVLGGAPEPVLTVTKALAEYLKKIAPAELAGKSPKQVEDYKKLKRRAVNNFVDLVGNKPFWDITREDALAFSDWWQNRIMGQDGQRRMSGNSGNRDVGNMRKMWRGLASREGRRDAVNPFDGLSFKDPRRLKQSPLPFTAKWIEGQLLQAPSYASTKAHPRALNREAAAIFLTVLETGCRPSEICNLVPERIRLEGNIPHIVVDFDEDRQVKTETSVRVIPLVGIALEVMRRFPSGFPRYRDKETTYSNTMMKHLRARDLLPSDRHKVYSARHAFEDRLKEAGVGDEMRRLLMGHSIDRPEYGSGGTLEYRLTLLEKIVLPFDPALLPYLDGA